MPTYINPQIILTTPIPNKRCGYYITFEPKQPDRLLIKCRSSKGRGMGIVGQVLSDGTIESTNQIVWSSITSTIKKKILFALELIKTNNIIINR